MTKWTWHSAVRKFTVRKSVSSLNLRLHVESSVPEAAPSLSPEQKDVLLHRYRNRPAEGLSYGTVRDYCDSADHIPYLSHLQGDLKDLQRPATLKAILGLLPPGSSLLEIGAGEPFVADVLSQLGYDVTVVDPYDGSGNGPTEFQKYVEAYPELRIIRSLFTEQVSGLTPGAFDCIYSISVLEHVHQPFLSNLFGGITRYLRPGGYSLHLIDQVLAGEGAEFHLHQLSEILALQSDLSKDRKAQLARDLANLLATLTADLETYYLSAEGHNNWRGATPYDAFSFRKVVSVSSCKQVL